VKSKHQSRSTLIRRDSLSTLTMALYGGSSLSHFDRPKCSIFVATCCFRAVVLIPPRFNPEELTSGQLRLRVPNYISHHDRVNLLESLSNSTSKGLSLTYLPRIITNIVTLRSLSLPHGEPRTTSALSIAHVYQSGTSPSTISRDSFTADAGVAISEDKSTNWLRLLLIREKGLYLPNPHRRQDSKHYPFKEQSRPKPFWKNAMLDILPVTDTARRFE